MDAIDPSCYLNGGTDLPPKAAYKYGKPQARNIKAGAEVRMADGRWATITGVERLRFDMRWRMERDGEFLAYVEVYYLGHHNTRRPKEA